MLNPEPDQCCNTPTRLQRSITNIPAQFANIWKLHEYYHSNKANQWLWRLAVKVSFALNENINSVSY